MSIRVGKNNPVLGTIQGFSLVPGRDCPGGAKCGRDGCYAMKAWRRFPDVRKAWLANSREARANPEAFCQGAADYCNSRALDYFRLHTAGDFFSQRYLWAWRDAAEASPSTRYLAYTKAFRLDYGGLPDNLVIMYSMWPGIRDTAPPGPRAWVSTDDRAPDGAYQCQGKTTIEVCSECLMCWTGVDVTFPYR